MIKGKDIMEKLKKMEETLKRQIKPGIIAGFVTVAVWFFLEQILQTKYNFNGLLYLAAIDLVYVVADIITVVLLKKIFESKR